MTEIRMTEAQARRLLKQPARQPREPTAKAKAAADLVRAQGLPERDNGHRKVEWWCCTHGAAEVHGPITYRLVVSGPGCGLLGLMTHAAAGRHLMERHGGGRQETHHEWPE